MTFPLFVTGRWNEAIERTSEISWAEMALADILGPLLTLPCIYTSRKDIESAQRVLTAFSRYRDSEDIQERAAYAVGEAVINSAQGNWSQALTLAEEATAMGRRIGPDNHMFKMGLDQGLDAAFSLGDLEKVEGLVSQIDGLRPAEITPVLRAIADRARARLSVTHGGRAGAEAGFKSSSAMFREVGAPYWLAATLVDYGEWLAAEGRATEAEPPLSEAVGIFENLGAYRWLDRLGASPAIPVASSTEATQS